MQPTSDRGAFNKTSTPTVLDNGALFVPMKVAQWRVTSGNAHCVKKNNPKKGAISEIL